MTSAPRFRVTLAPIPGQVPPLTRLRQALKVLRRRFGLRCEAIEQLPEPPRPA